VRTYQVTAGAGASHPRRSLDVKEQTCCLREPQCHSPPEGTLARSDPWTCTCRRPAATNGTKSPCIRSGARVAGAVPLMGGSCDTLQPVLKLEAQGDSRSRGRSRRCRRRFGPHKPARHRPRCCVYVRLRPGQRWRAAEFGCEQLRLVPRLVREPAVACWGSV